MAEAVKVAVRQRTVLGKKSESLRRRGILPGVVYGGHAESQPIETDAREFERGYRSWGSTTLLSLEGIGGDGTPALISGVSRHPVTGKILHVDFERVSLTERTHAEVPLHFVGTAPALKAGGVLVHATEHVRVEALPQDIPHRIDVDLTKLEAVDDAIYVRDLIVDTTTVRIVDRPEALVVKAVHQRVEEIAPAPAAAAAAAEGAAPVEGEAPAEGAAPAAAPAAKGAAPAAPAKGAPAPAAKAEKK
ncbi:MAG: 50S ribosomal protein L25 [Chloroflexi bacterium]|nr:50S ribosomal protein L25 [Chloroflexota bacterium]